jgi:hypothetical protein
MRIFTAVHKMPPGIAGRPQEQDRHGSLVLLQGEGLTGCPPGCWLAQMTWCIHSTLRSGKVCSLDARSTDLDRLAGAPSEFLNGGLISRSASKTTMSSSLWPIASDILSALPPLGSAKA